MTREIREVKDDFGTITFIPYCNTIDQYLVNFDFKTKDACALFIKYWYRGFDISWQGTMTEEDVKEQWEKFVKDSQ